MYNQEEEEKQNEEGKTTAGRGSNCKMAQEAGTISGDRGDKRNGRRRTMGWYMSKEALRVCVMTTKEYKQTSFS